MYDVEVFLRPLIGVQNLEIVREDAGETSRTPDSLGDPPTKTWKWRGE